MSIHIQAKSIGRFLVSALLLFARFLIASAYFLLYIYTPMLLPTQVGMCKLVPSRSLMCRLRSRRLLPTLLFLCRFRFKFTRTALELH
jgi:hypothetical protein